MIRIAQKHNAAAKFPGSGGAVVGLCRGDHGRRNLSELRKEYEEEVRAACFVDHCCDSGWVRSMSVLRREGQYMMGV